MLKKISASLFAFMLGLISQVSMAAPVDLAPLTTAVDFSSVFTAILAIGVILMGLYVAIRGVKFVIAMVRSA